MVLSKYQKAILVAFNGGKANLNISAVAGSGKTTMLLELLKCIEGKSTLFLAFNKSIVEELRSKSKDDNAQIMTIHSCGWRAIMRHYGNVRMNPNKCIAKTEKAMKSLKVDEKKKGYYFYIVPKILDLMRCNLTEPNDEAITELIMHYDVDLERQDYELVKRAFKYLTEDKSQFDFMDMIYVPVVDSRVRVSKYDYVFCDESQDFSAAQQEFIKSCINRDGRLVTVGDKNQAIYGFAGADADSYDRLSSINGKSISMPLSVSYRCAKNIVDEAQKIVPEIRANMDAKYGMVRNGSLIDIQYGDWVLCRNVKPLVQTYLWLMKNKIKSKIKGRDIGEGILSLITKVGGGKTIPDLLKKLELEGESILDRLAKRGVRHPTYHPKMEMFNQRCEVISYLCGEVDSVKDLKKLIGDIFSDDISGIMLSTIHKSKGLENERIFFLCPELIPSKYAVMDWQLEQERNLKYVGITRAKDELIYVSSETFMSDIQSRLVI